jgi:hypothetical protein
MKKKEMLRIDIPYLKLLVHVAEGEYALIELVHHLGLLVFI